MHYTKIPLLNLFKSGLMLMA